MIILKNIIVSICFLIVSSVGLAHTYDEFHHMPEFGPKLPPAGLSHSNSNCPILNGRYRADGKSEYVVITTWVDTRGTFHYQVSNQFVNKSGSWFGFRSGIREIANAVGVYNVSVCDSPGSVDFILAKNNTNKVWTRFKVSKITDKSLTYNQCSDWAWNRYFELKSEL